MPRNGTGVYTLPNPPFVAGTIISSSVMNQNLQDIAAALTGSVAADGQTPFSGTIVFPNGTPSAPGISFQSDLTTGIYYAGPNQLGFAAGGVPIVRFENDTGGLNTGNIITQLNGAVLQPVGTVLDFAGNFAPFGWFLCFGQAISRASYPELFNTIGTTYGPGDGSTTYNLPDLRGLVTAGKDNMGGTSANRITNFAGTALGASGGEQNHTLITNELAAHNHGVNDAQHSHGVSDGNVAGTGTTTAAPIGNVVPLNAQPILIDLASSNITIQNTGGGAGHNNLQPTIIMNKIIFAGRQ